MIQALSLIPKCDVTECKQDNVFDTVTWIFPTYIEYELQVGSCTTGGPVAAQQYLLCLRGNSC